MSIIPDGVNPPSEAIDIRKRATLATRDEAGLQMQELFRQALDKGAEGVGALEKLIDLQERVHKRRAELEFSLALAAFQNECPPVQKTSTANIASKSGTGYKFTYADLEEIIATVRPHLMAHGFSFTFDSDTDGRMLTCVCTLRHEAGHRESSKFVVPTESPSAATPAQKMGGALTYAKRQSLIGVLGLSLTDPVPEEHAAVAKVTEEQAATLTALLAETGVSLEKFGARFNVAAVADLPATLYAEAVRLLEAKRKAVAK